MSLFPFWASHNSYTVIYSRGRLQFISACGCELDSFFGCLRCGKHHYFLEKFTCIWGRMGEKICSAIGNEKMFKILEKIWQNRAISFYMRNSRTWTNNKSLTFQSIVAKLEHAIFPRAGLCNCAFISQITSHLLQIVSATFCYL